MAWYANAAMSDPLVADDLADVRRPVAECVDVVGGALDRAQRRVWTVVDHEVAGPQRLARGRFEHADRRQPVTTYLRREALGAPAAVARWNRRDDDDPAARA